MKHTKLSVTLLIVLCLGMGVIPSDTRDPSSETTVGDFADNRQFLVDPEQSDRLGWMQGVGLPAPDTALDEDSLVTIREAYKAAVETMLDDRGTISHGMDTSISPCDDHYQFVNGGWRKNVVMPKSLEHQYQLMNVFTYAHLRLIKRMQHLLDSARAIHASTSNPTLRTLGTFYESCMIADTLEHVILKRKRLSRFKVDSTRNQECLSRTFEHLGAASGQYFAEELKTSGAIKRMDVMTSALKQAISEQLKENSLLDAEEKRYALDRLSRLLFRVGVPDSLVDYNKLKLSATDYIGNKEKIAVFMHSRWIGSIGENLREKWKASLLMANAFYMPYDHAIEIPTLMFLPPFFYRDGEDAVNFGAVGFIIGHEITHSVAPQLLLVKDPRMKAEMDSLREFHSGLGEFEEWRPDGKRTFTEDVADLGGARAAYRAWKETVKKDKKYSVDGNIDGFTPDQRFFISMGRVWRTQWTKYGVVEWGVHGPSFARVNGTAKQTPAFRTAFGCKPGDKMYLRDDQFSKIW